VGLTVDKPEVYSLHVASYKQMTNKKPWYMHVHCVKFVSTHIVVQDYKWLLSYTTFMSIC